MNTRCTPALLAAICGWLFFVCPVQAQLARVWRANISSMGTKSSVPLVDDSGSVYVLGFAGSAYSGARVTKYKNDGTLDWQTDYPYPGLELHYFGLGPDGSTYVVGQTRLESWSALAVGIKFDPAGNLAWDQSIAPLEAPYFGYSSPKGAVDADGNLWIGVNESPTDSLCIDSLPDGSGNAGQSIEMSKGVLYRLQYLTGFPLEVQRIDGGPRRPSGILELVGNGDGYVCARVMFSEFCCNSQCQGCRDACFEIYGSYQHENGYYRTVFELWKFTDAGGLAGVVPLSSSDNAIFESAFRVGRNGEFFVKQDVYTSDFTRSSSNWLRPGFWSTPLEGGADNQQQYVTDYRGNVLLLQSVGDDGDPGYYAQTCFIDGVSGSVRWVKPIDLGSQYGGDRDGNVFIIGGGTVHKFDEWGGEIWSYHAPAYMYSFVSCDTADGFYFIDGSGFAKYTDRKYLTIRDANKDSIPDTEFELIRVANDPPFFTEDTLGMFTTDARGRFKLNMIATNTFLAELDLSTDTLFVGDSLKIAKHIESIPPVRHPGVLGTMCSIHLDNAQFASDGHMFFDSLTNSDQDLVLNHTELRYNLLVSVEWEADQGYLQGLQGNFRELSNFLYDVYDGQVRLDTVIIFDHGNFGSEADIHIVADNTLWPFTRGGIDDPWWEGITMPRKFFNDTETDNRNLSYSENPLDLLSYEDFRTKAHEFGHYAFNFWDEYKFADATGAFVNEPSLRCGSVNNYGYMDMQYSDRGEHASELSSIYRYGDFSCRNNEQWGNTGLSCWDQLEAQSEGLHSPDEIYVPIIKPNDSARSLPEGSDFLPGPNDGNYLLSQDYNVGSLIVFPETPYPPPAGYGTLHVQVLSKNGIHPQPNAKVEIANNYFSFDREDPMLEGYTSDKNPDVFSNGGGCIRVLGANTTNYLLLVEAWMSTQVLPPADAPGYATVSDEFPDRVWLCGQASAGGAGIDKVANAVSRSANGDSLVITLISVEGDHPALVQAVPGGSGMEYRLLTDLPFPSDPSLEVYASGEDFIEYPLTSSAYGYIAQVSDSLDREGTFRVWAVDDSSQTFFFSTPYVQYLPASSATSREWYGPGGKSELTLDSANSAIQKIVILSSAYPVPKTGLGQAAVQAGAAISVGVVGQVQLEGDNSLSLRYDPSELQISEEVVGDESTLQLYHWNESSSIWEVVTGTGVNQEDNTVFGSISSPGTYAAFTTQIITDVENDEYDGVLPYKFELSQNYPNPFNPATTIEYSLPERSRVMIEVFNVLGQKVRTLVDREESAGLYTATWDGTDTDGVPVSTGVYIYRFEAGDHVETKKMLLLR